MGPFLKGLQESTWAIKFPWGLALAAMLMLMFMDLLAHEAVDY